MPLASPCIEAVNHELRRVWISVCFSPVRPSAAVDAGIAASRYRSASLGGIARRTSFCPVPMITRLLRVERGRSRRAVFAEATLDLRDLLDEGVSLFLGLFDKRLRSLKDLVDKRLSLLKSLIHD